MAIIKKINGVDEAALHEAIRVFSDQKTPEARAAVIAVFKKASVFKSGCSVCISSLRHFENGLNAIENGQNPTAHFNAAFARTTFKLTALNALSKVGIKL